MPGCQPRIKLGGDCRFTASLRVWHPSLDPRLITAALALQPEHSHRRGDRRRTPKGRLLPGYERQSFWRFRVVAHATMAEEFVRAVDGFLDRIAPAGKFLHDVRAGGGEVNLFVGWFFDVSSALPLDHPWLGKLGSLAIDLDLDIYGGSDEDA